MVCVRRSRNAPRPNGTASHTRGAHGALILPGSLARAWALVAETVGFLKRGSCVCVTSVRLVRIARLREAVLDADIRSQKKRFERR